MKLIMVAMFLSFSTFAANYNFIIDGYKKIPGMDYQLILIDRNPIENHRIFVDCQSFINGVHYEKNEMSRWNDVWYLVVSGNECEEIRSFVFDSNNKSMPFCMQFDDENRNLNFSLSIPNCL